MRGITFVALLLACATTPSWWSRPNPEAEERVKRLAAQDAQKALEQPIHDHCVAAAEHYASYEECYLEKSKETDKPKMSAGQALPAGR
jgi:predicted house-cleaning NTP pyrophosphatase (Maf/HAM1 superfamily)